MSNEGVVSSGSAKVDMASRNEDAVDPFFGKNG